MNMANSYTHKINLYRNVKGLGWMFQSFPTTEDAVRVHVKTLSKQQVAGQVRNLEVIRLR